MNFLIEPSPEQIQAEIAMIREAGKRVAATRESAAAFLKRIGVGEWLRAEAHEDRSEQTKSYNPSTTTARVRISARED